LKRLCGCEERHEAAAVTIAAAFASGIALGLHPVVARHASSLAFLSLSFVGRGFPCHDRHGALEVWASFSRCRDFPSLLIFLDASVPASQSNRGVRTTSYRSWRKGASV